LLQRTQTRPITPFADRLAMVRHRLLIAVIVPLRAAEISVPGAPMHLHIEAGDASLMLNEFSRETDIQVLFDFNLVRRLRTPAVNGTYSPTEGLKQLLKGTGLTFDWVNDRTLAVTPTPALHGRLAHVVEVQETTAHEDRRFGRSHRFDYGGECRTATSRCPRVAV
jgi:hypothetical protein